MLQHADAARCLVEAKIARRDEQDSGSDKARFPNPATSYLLYHAFFAAGIEFRHPQVLVDCTVPAVLVQRLAMWSFSQEKPVLLHQQQKRPFASHVPLLAPLISEPINK